MNTFNNFDNKESNQRLISENNLALVIFFFHKSPSSYSLLVVISLSSHCHLFVLSLSSFCHLREAPILVPGR